MADTWIPRGTQNYPPKGSSKVVGNWEDSFTSVYWILTWKGTNAFALAKLGSERVRHFGLSQGWSHSLMELILGAPRISFSVQRSFAVSRAGSTCQVNKYPFSLLLLGFLTCAMDAGAQANSQELLTLIVTSAAPHQLCSPVGEPDPQQLARRA